MAAKQEPQRTRRARALVIGAIMKYSNFSFVSFTWSHLAAYELSLILIKLGKLDLRHCRWLLWFLCRYSIVGENHDFSALFLRPAVPFWLHRVFQSRGVFLQTPGLVDHWLFFSVTSLLWVVLGLMNSWYRYSPRREGFKKRAIINI